MFMREETGKSAFFSKTQFHHVPFEKVETGKSTLSPKNPVSIQYKRYRTSKEIHVFSKNPVWGWIWETAAGADRFLYRLFTKNQEESRSQGCGAPGGLDLDTCFPSLYKTWSDIRIGDFSFVRMHSDKEHGRHFCRPWLPSRYGKDFVYTLRLFSKPLSFLLDLFQHSL